MRAVYPFFTFLIIAVLSVAQAETVKMQIQANTNVRSVDERKGNVLAREMTLPKGSVVEISTRQLEEPILMRFWNALVGREQKPAEFVKDIKLISAPGFSAEEVREFNELNAEEPLYMSKKMLADADVLSKKEESRRRLRTRRQTDAMRSHDVRRRKDEATDRASTRRILENIEQGNRSARSAGAQGTCEGCETGFYQRWVRAGVPERALRQALDFYNKNKPRIRNKRYVTINDLTDHSSQKRMFILDMQTGAVERHYTAHGSGSDPGHRGNAARLGNGRGQSPKGFMLTGETYRGGHGLSMRLDGAEAHNRPTRKRLVVMHSADYASPRWLRRYGKLGRSQGCVAVDPAVSRQLIQKLKGGSLMMNFNG